MNDTPIRDCPRCGEPYYVYNMMVGDQSMCPDCRAKLVSRIEERRRKQTDTASRGVERG